MRLGVISEWLLVGPFDLPADYPENSELSGFVDSLVPDAAVLRPDAGEELAGKKWKTVALESSVINWSEVFSRDATRPHPPAAVLGAYICVFAFRAGRRIFRSSRLCRCNVW